MRISKRGCSENSLGDIHSKLSQESICYELCYILTDTTLMYVQEVFSTQVFSLNLFQKGT